MEPGESARPTGLSVAKPSVAELLAVDREYRERAARRELPMIAPHRFNPTNEHWLPVLHTTRGERRYTALFSNTATAHRMGRTHDWVVIYCEGAGDGQCTVVTEYRGSLARRRVVRGREAECIAYYHPNVRNGVRNRPTRRRRKVAGRDRRANVNP